ncbi:MAG: HDIG domain-containing protein [Clostridiales bacterium]|nr:HDIG domain-containing protein [Clostridiales bacterium]
MKLDNEISKTIENNSIIAETNHRDKKSIILLSILPFLSIFLVVALGFLKKTDTIENIKTGILTFILTTIMVFFIRIQIDITKIRFSKTIIFLANIVSILLVMLIKNPEVYSFWLLGGLITAMIIDNKLGLLLSFNMTFILGLTYALGVGLIIHFLVMGVLLALLAKHLKDKSTVTYSAIIILSTDITLSFIINNFIFATDKSYNYMASIFSIFAVLVTAFLLSYLYDKYINNTSDDISKDTLIADESDNLLDNLDKSSGNTDLVSMPASDKVTKTSYDLLISDNNELLIKMKEYSESLYNHCKLIGDLSGRAARAIGANENLARTGGYYHEVGKLQGKNYIEEGLKLADKYSFPKELKEVLKQHNIKYDKPTFVESAIVMLSDNLVSTIEYIEKTGKQKFTTDKIIDNIFKMRMDKGTFDDALLSIKDFNLLKEFYKNEFGLRDKDLIKED